MISVLFVEDDSVYKTLPVDCWDEHRDARLYKGDNVVIAHPPCRLWSRMRQFSTAPLEEKQLALLALKIVQKNGGILEHPRGSILWKLPEVNDKGFMISVNQSWWGHPCEKKTILLVCGIKMRDMPAMPLCFDTPQKVIHYTTKRPGRVLPKSQRNRTPVRFAEWLIETAKIIENQ